MRPCRETDVHIHVVTPFLARAVSLLGHLDGEEGAELSSHEDKDES